MKEIRDLSSVLAATAIALAGCGDAREGSSAASASSSVEETVTIKRDSYGVPHVYADDTYGLFYGYGYALAEDRLFQMEMAKRSVMGTVSEVLGTSYVSHDTRSRSGSTHSSIADQLSALKPTDRDIFDGYAEGFNARLREVLADPDDLMPKQFIDFGFEPVEWTGLDVAMIWVGTMANRFSNGSSEIFNLATLNRLEAELGEVAGRQMFDQIRWMEDPRAPTTVPRGPEASSLAAGAGAGAGASARDESSASATTGGLFVNVDRTAELAPVSDSVLSAGSVLEASWRGIVSPDDRPTASNLWIVGPDKTVDGSTILNNGPQFGWYNPSYTYGIGLHGAGYDVTGQTPFAHPVILFGTNGTTSWGATAGPLDVNDYYQVRLNPANQHEYFYDGSYRAMLRRSEVIEVKDADDVVIEVYSTVHGTVTSFDPENGAAYAFKRSWEGLEVESLMGWIYLMKARSWDEFLEQAARVAITINLYYADSSGNIGYVSPGRLPIRPRSQDSRLPAIGDGSMEWQGFRPFSESPRVLNPEQGYIVNWNNQSAAGHGAHGSWSVVDRATEFIARIEAKDRLTPDEVWELLRLTSFADTNARYFVPVIAEASAGLDPGDPLRVAAQMLIDWDMQNTNPTGSDSYAESAATIMRTWLPLMYERVLMDDLPEDVLSSSAGYPGRTSRGSVRPGTGSTLLYNAFLGDGAGVPQTFDFFNGADEAGKNAIVLQALRETVDRLTAEFGSDPSLWSTPVSVHSFRSTNFFGVPAAGSDEALELPTFMNRGTQNHQVTFDANGVSMCSIAPPGQSSFVAPDGTVSPHYRDQMELYESFGCKPDRLTEQELDQDLESIRTLTVRRAADR
jgi:penicillin amidase